MQNRLSNPFIPEKFATQQNSESTLELKQQISEIRADLQNCFNLIRDVSELRYANHQNIGCVEARQNDMRDQLHVHEKRIEKLESEVNDQHGVEFPLIADIGVLKKRIEALEKDRLVDIIGRIDNLEDKLPVWSISGEYHALQRRVQALEQGRMPDPDADKPKVTCEHIEPKTTRLTFAEAMQAMDEGKAVKRRGGDWHVLIATDWEIAE
jgi:hypothetical protein